ncbi:hypothetical protein B0A55_11027 [Friedmanniomyces simplex]|uniref:Uncharacterized protein n=1 Tax=Friedmanniomyces simplex TaxID=329884 RepID=A0A4U0WFS4_9PEZI|nr:hypothetical protein B0A55_11027 [Friedmanniomyces simplex]
MRASVLFSNHSWHLATTNDIFTRVATPRRLHIHSGAFWTSATTPAASSATLLPIRYPAFATVTGSLIGVGTLNSKAGGQHEARSARLDEEDEEKQAWTW